MGAANWGPKFDRNTGRLERRFELCGFYDETSEHGGPRERRQADDSSICDIDEETGFCRYDKNNPIRGIQQITKGFSKWAQRYVEECKLQPAKQVDRMAKWFGQLTGKLAHNHVIKIVDLLPNSTCYSRLPCYVTIAKKSHGSIPVFRFQVKKFIGFFSSELL